MSDSTTYWKEQLAGVTPLELPTDFPRLPAPSFMRETARRPLGREAWQRVVGSAAANGVDPFTVALAAFGLLAHRTTGQEAMWVGTATTTAGGPNLLPIRLAVGDRTVGALLAETHTALSVAGNHREVPFSQLAALASGPIFRALVLPAGPRSPLWEASTPPELSALGAAAADCDLVLTVAASEDGASLQLSYDPELYTAKTAERVLGQLEVVLAGMASRPDARLLALSLVGAEERARLVSEWNRTETAYDKQATTHSLIEAQVARTPEAVALVFAEEELTYRQLNARANQLAHLLISKGVKADVPVGICIERSAAMVIAVLAVHKAGGAYIPMDPGYPAKRIAYMVEDSGVKLVLADSAAAEAAAGGAEVIRVDRSPEARLADGNPSQGVPPSALAYIMYTSGSTGNPKGVMVEHRNVVSFFAGMDQRLGTEPGVWLAVTSLSFDISVLELLWTLSHGFKVVLFSTRVAHGASSTRPVHGAAMDFGLFYFASDEGDYAKATGRDKYKLLLDGARFADEHGFLAVWTPERHFHTFGGLYPSPSIAAGAIAMFTKRVSIRAGSVVLPLHNPVHVAEEWSLVDNLSDGRVAISFASGWQPQDFLLSPENYPDRHNKMFEGIETIRALWRGEQRTLPGGDGKPVTFITRPRPVQAELPVWVTAGGSPETFRRAGAIGAGVLTHLLGQSLEQLSERIAVYRKAWKEAGHPGEGGRVALMLHTFVSSDDAHVREVAHDPLKNYLKGAVGLFAPVAAAKGLDINNLSPEDLDALAEHAFERYFATSGLFGTPESCLPMIQRLKTLGVDELACLIDFGIPAETVLANLPFLDELRRRCTGATAERNSDQSIGGLIRFHAATHLQCTPSMASMLVGDAGTATALASLERMMVGGEALSEPLAAELRKAVPNGVVTNMYGPTETTVWSMTHDVGPESGPIPIGRPVANTQIYLLDSALNPVPVGVQGELYIGGDGVTRGYFKRPELTKERFLDDPFVKGNKIYRTGDLARHRPDGIIDFLGRVDHQVKLRGYRIELGEIEAVLRQHSAVAEAAVVVREDRADDKRLVAYVVGKTGHAVPVEELRAQVRATLAEYMVPAAFVTMTALPLTPNGKIDRKALPAPDAVAAAEAPAGADMLGDNIEQTVTEIWAEVLKVPTVGPRDNFFDLGGHSLLMVHVLNRLRAKTTRELSMTDMFRYPTVESLAGFLRGSSGSGQLNKVQERAAQRRERLLGGRRPQS